jgi:hypothetical protein
MLQREAEDYNAFRHYLHTVFLGSAQPEKRLLIAFSMTEFTAYFDESHGREDAYAVAGYVAPVGQWVELAREFRELGRQEGFTVLHKSDLEHNIVGSEFEWPDLDTAEKRAKKLRINSRACRIIKRRVNAGFAAAVKKSVWESVVTTGPWGNVLGKSFYAAGVYACLHLVSMWADRFSRNDPIRYVYEEGADGRDEAEKMLRQVKRDRKRKQVYRFSGYSFESKNDPNFVPLQAADFLAYESYRQLDNRVLQGIKKDKEGRDLPVRGAMKCLLYYDDGLEGRYYNRADKLPTPIFPVWLDEKEIIKLAEALDNLAIGGDGSPSD